MSDKLKIFIFSAACVFTFLIGVFCGVVSRKDKTEYIYVPEYVNAAQPLNPATDPVPLPTPVQYYYMNSYNGIIYVYSCDENNNLALMLEIDYIDINSLTDDQKQKLIDGISFAGMEDVARFIQDLGT